MDTQTQSFDVAVIGAGAAGMMAAIRAGELGAKVAVIDYKDADVLRRYLTERGKIKPRRKIGTCARHQRALALAVKRARHIALLPFADPRVRD